MVVGVIRYHPILDKLALDSDAVLSLYRQLTQVTGLNKISSKINGTDDIRNLETEPGMHWRHSLEILNELC